MIKFNIKSGYLYLKIFQTFLNKKGITNVIKTGQGSTLLYLECEHINSKYVLETAQEIHIDLEYLSVSSN